MALLKTDPAVIKSQIERLQQELEERERKFERSLIKSQLRQGAISKEFKGYAKSRKPPIIEVLTSKSRNEVITNAATVTQIKIQDNKNKLEVEFGVSGDRKEDCVFQLDPKKVGNTIETNYSNIGADNSSRKSKRKLKTIDYSKILKGNSSKRSKIDPKEVATLAFEVIIQAAKERPIEDFHLPLNFFTNYSYSFSSRIDDVRNIKFALDAKSKMPSKIRHQEYSKRPILNNQSVEERLKSSLEDETTRVIKKESQFPFCNENILRKNSQDNCQQKELAIFSVSPKNQKIPVKISNCPNDFQIDVEEIEERSNLKQKLLQIETEDILKNNLVKTKISNITKHILDSSIKSSLKQNPQVQNIWFQSNERGIIKEQDLEIFIQENDETNQKPDSIVACKEHNELIVSKRKSNDESLDPHLNTLKETKNEYNVGEIILESETEDIVLDKAIKEGYENDLTVIGLNNVKDFNKLEGHDHVNIVQIDDEPVLSNDATNHSNIQKPDSIVARKEHIEQVISQKSNELLDILAKNLNSHEETKKECNVGEMILENETEDIFLNKSIGEGCETDLTVIGFSNVKDFNKLSDSVNIVQIDELVFSNGKTNRRNIHKPDPFVACKEHNELVISKKSNDKTLNHAEESKNERNVGEKILENEIEDIFHKSIEENPETDLAIIADIGFDKLQVSDCANLLQIDHEPVLSDHKSKCILATKLNPSGESIIEHKDNIEEVFVDDTEDIFIDKSSQEGVESNLNVIPEPGLNYSEKLNLIENVIPMQTKENSIKSNIQNQSIEDLEGDTVVTQFGKSNQVHEREYVNEMNRNNGMFRNTLKDIGNIRDSSSQSKNNWEGRKAEIDGDAMKTSSIISGNLFVKKRSSDCFKCVKNEPVLKIHYITKESPLIAIQQLKALQFLKLNGNCEWEELHHISLVEDIIVSFVVVDYVVIITMTKFFWFNYNDFTEFYKDHKTKCPQNLMACSLQNSYFATCSIAENHSSIMVHKIKSGKNLSTKELERSSEKLTSICTISNLAKVMAGITSTGIILWSYRLGSIKLIINFDPVIESPFKIHWIQREMKDNLLYCLLKRNDLPNTNLVVINPVTGKHQILRKYENGMNAIDNKRCSFSVNNLYATEVITKKKLIVYDFYHGIEKAALESESLTTGVVVFPNGKTNIILTGYDNGCLHTFVM